MFSPAFVADCLETIYEIGVEYDHIFKQHGGEKVTLVESLNAKPEWVEALAGMVSSIWSHTRAWSPSSSPPASRWAAVTEPVSA